VKMNVSWFRNNL